ncbi:MAG: hypothetical protein IIW07_04155 [Clostridia bacterium]|nr:hypothetical protein [Clostridia bacterium]
MSAQKRRRARPAALCPISAPIGVSKCKRGREASSKESDSTDPKEIDLPSPTESRTADTAP